MVTHFFLVRIDPAHQKLDLRIYLRIFNFRRNLRPIPLNMNSSSCIKDAFRPRFRSTSPAQLILVTKLSYLPGDPPEIITKTFQMNDIFNSVIDE